MIASCPFKYLESLCYSMMTAVRVAFMQEIDEMMPLELFSFQNYVKVGKVQDNSIKTDRIVSSIGQDQSMH